MVNSTNSLSGMGGGVDADTLRDFLNPEFISKRLPPEIFGDDTEKFSDADVFLDKVFNTPWTARYQSDRNTCTPFANAASVELLLAQKGEYRQLSPEFLYWIMRNDLLHIDQCLIGWKQGTTNSQQAKDVLEELGICSEESWTYSPTIELGKEAEPNDAAYAEAKSIQIVEKEYYSHRAEPNAKNVALRILKQLQDDCPVAMGIPTYRFENDNKGSSNWINARAVNSGIVFGPGESVYEGKRPLEIAGHVVCIVGFQADPNAPGGGWFIFKNSWGTRFGKYSNRDQSAVPYFQLSGYGALSMNHANLCWEYLSLKLK